MRKCRVGRLNETCCRCGTEVHLEVQLRSSHSTVVSLVCRQNKRLTEEENLVEQVLDSTVDSSIIDRSLGNNC